MKNLMFILVVIILSSCSKKNDEVIKPADTGRYVYLTIKRHYQSADSNIHTDSLKNAAGDWRRGNWESHSILENGIIYDTTTNTSGYTDYVDSMFAEVGDVITLHLALNHASGYTTTGGTYIPAGVLVRLQSSSTAFSETTICKDTVTVQDFSFTVE